jgi:hypothetical protein
MSHTERLKPQRHQARGAQRTSCQGSARPVSLWLTRLLGALGAYALVSLLFVGTAAAQMAGALGKPLPSPDLDVGTVSVRVVAGAPSSPVTGIEVTLVVNGATRAARTDAAGRAFFKDLPPGAKLQAKIVDEDQKDVSSEEFELPASGGVRVMLSTRPWSPGAGGTAAAAGGAGGVPPPRQMSGEPQPDTNDVPGTMTVRLSYNDFAAEPPVDVPVVIVGYAHDGKVTTQVVKTGQDGRAKFKGLDRTGGTSYFAMAQLPRNGAIDRLASTAVVLDPRSGVRLILSSDTRDSTAPPIDDLAKLEAQDAAPPAGKIRVGLEGGADPNATITLIDAEQQLVVGRAKAEQAPPDPSDVQAQARFDDKPDVPVPAGTLRLKVHGGSRSDDPLAGVAVRLVPASTQASSGEPPQLTPASGELELTTALKEPVIAVVTINGKELRSPPLDLTKSGGILDVTARWPSQGKPEVMFDLVPRAGQVLYVETSMHGQSYRSLPFQPLAKRGTRVTLFIYPRVLFRFSLTSRIDDEYLGVNGRFEVSNNSWSPFVAGPDGMMIPLPKGFVGGLVAEKDQADVALVPGEGFRIIRPIPPGQRAFHGAFSLTVKGGDVTWNWDLPWGAYNSGIEFLQVPGMQVSTPPGVNGQTMTVPQGTFFVLPQISILPKQAMAMTIRGLPSPPAWRVWLPRIIGAIVVLVMLGGVLFAIYRARSVPPALAARHARRQQLLDELVELEKTGSQDPKREEQILAELETLWDDAA